MLVLARRLSEQVVIDGRITLTVVKIGKDKVRLGFDADPSIPVDRREIWLAKRAGKREADEDA